MFTNIGGKIKVLVIVATILNIFACITYGTIMILYAILGSKMLGFLSAVGLDKAVVDMTGGARGAFGIAAGIVIIIAGSFACWLIAFIPYGLGQLIQNSDRIVKNTEAAKTGLAKIHKTQQEGGVSTPYGMYPYPIYTDQFGRPVYPPMPGYAAYPDEEIPGENGTEASEAETAEDTQMQEKTEQAPEPALSSENGEKTSEEKKPLKEKHFPFPKKSEKKDKKDAE